MVNDDAPEPRERTEEAAPGTGANDSSQQIGGADRAADRRHALLVALVVGIVGVLGTLFGSLVQIYGADRSQEAAFSEERAKEDRAKRADVYFEFLKAANEYAFDVDQAQECLAKFQRPLRGEEAWRQQVPPEQCTQLLDDLTGSRRTLDGARYRVYVYGSSEAEGRARAVWQYLPQALGWKTWGSDLPMMDGRLFNFNEAAFGQLYANFQRVACREVPVHPRPDC